MLPFSFEWVWDMTHLVFMGALGFALTVIGIGMTYCLVKSIYDTVKGKSGDSH